ncbi:MAG: divalent-cation tolerance protein CutA [Candidatus Brocadiia bacterium]
MFQSPNLQPDLCAVFVTVGKRDEAEKIGSALVEEKLAACCNLVGPIRSIYRWKGEICRDEETLLILKTRRDGFEKLRARVVQLHSYTVPEIVALPIVAGHAPYLDWVRDETLG